MKINGHKIGNLFSHSAAITWIVIIAILTIVYNLVSRETREIIHPWLDAFVWVCLGGMTVLAFVQEVGRQKRKQQGKKEQRANSNG